MLLAQGIAARGAVNGDRFVVGSITLIVALVLAFIFFPVARILSGALVGEDGGFAPLVFVERFVDPRIWGLGCLAGGPSCGVAWNTLALAITTGAATTLLGLAFALVVTRTAFPFKRALRALTILPIITPPFVISLAIILLFGRSGTVTSFVADLLGIDGGRWVYGFTGVLLAQVLSFTPIAFLVMIGVVEGVSPSLEEASQTLHASRWQTFTTISLPLMRPGLANAFLLGFIESMADFGNPLVLGGNFQVLSTEIFFAIVGAQHDPGRAAMLAIVLLFFTLLAFWAQQQLAGPEIVHQRLRQGRCRDADTAPGAAEMDGLHDHHSLGRLHRHHVRHDPVRRLRRDLGPRPQLHAAPLPQRLRRHPGRLRAGLVRHRLEQLRDDPADRRRLGDPDGADRPADRLAARPPAASAASAPSSSAPCCPSPFPAR